MVRTLHQIEPWMRLETLAGIYAAAVKVYINDIVHALTMRSAKQKDTDVMKMTNFDHIAKSAVHCAQCSR